jgi:hypothetical protein
VRSDTVTEWSEPPAAYLAENPHAGQGPVMLEIGVDTGALIVSAPVDLVGREIEIHTSGVAALHAPGEPAHDHAHTADHEHSHAPHVAVIPRALPNGGTVHCAVFPDLAPGRYTLWLLPEGPAMPVVVRAGQVTTTHWTPAEE